MTGGGRGSGFGYGRGSEKVLGGLGGSWDGLGGVYRRGSGIIRSRRGAGWRCGRGLERGLGGGLEVV